MNGQPFHNQNKYRLGKAAALGLLLSCLFGVVACSDEEVPDPQLYTADGVPYSYVSVGFSLAMNPVTKANPNGGEEGDDDEKGQSYENAVNNIHLFFYNVKDPAKGGKDGVNMPGDTAIVAHKYLESGDFDYSDVQATTNAIPVENLLVGHSYHVLAVVNAGEDLNYTKLDNLQRATVTSLYTKGTDGSYSNFLMASERDEESPLTITSNNSETTPATTTIYVERVTARVDYQTEPEFTGEIKNSAGETIATASITGAMLVNTLNASATSYLLKRVTTENEAFNSDITYLGDETCTSDAIKAATNYVIDPYAASGKPEGYYETATYFPNIGYDNASTWEQDELFQTTAITSGETTWNRIGYPKENVNQNGSKECSTGVVFRVKIILAEATDATTFFMWKGTIYKTMEEVMAAFDPKGWDNITGDWSKWTTYGTFRGFINSLRSGDPTGYKAYLLEQVKDKDDEDELTQETKATLKWEEYMAQTFFYVKDDTDVVAVDVETDVASGTTRRLLHDYQVSTYKDGICYYTYWIKHANDGKPENDLENGDGTGVMEYAIVRNNVYKLGVQQIGSIGGDIPGDESLVINFSVRDWTLIPAEEIELGGDKQDNTQGGE